MTRQQKTPRQRAQEALALEERRVKRLTEQWTKARDTAERLGRDRDAAVVRRNYLAQNPDLQHNPTNTPGDPA